MKSEKTKRQKVETRRYEIEIDEGGMIVWDKFTKTYDVILPLEKHEVIALRIAFQKVLGES